MTNYDYGYIEPFATFRAIIESVPYPEGWIVIGVVGVLALIGLCSLVSFIWDMVALFRGEEA